MFLNYILREKIISKKSYLSLCSNSGISQILVHEDLLFRLIQEIIYNLIKYINSSLI